MIEQSDYKSMIENATTSSELDSVKVHFLGRNGLLTNQLKALSQLDIETRKEKGKALNEVKIAIENAIKEKLLQLEIIANANKKNEIDYTIAPNVEIGHEHLISKSIKALHRIFEKAGFNEILGPDIEDVFYNFEALNIAKEHPARDNNDTFYMHEQNQLLRTQVTCVQARLLEKMQEQLQNFDPEIKSELSQTRSYSIGRVYRNDSHDATHACMFHQIEGVIIEDGVTMQNLKGFLEYLFSEFFLQDIKVRFRPSYFPFTEPSCEVDVFTKQINGKLVIQNDGSGTPLELGGCGIIHPTILERFGMDDQQAFAFGMGLERIIMVKHGITNLHDLYNNHVPTLRYISQC